MGPVTSAELVVDILQRAHSGSVHQQAGIWGLKCPEPPRGEQIACTEASLEAEQEQGILQSQPGGGHGTLLVNLSMESPVGSNQLLTKS